MGNPLSKGNFIVLKGDKRASGKLIVAEGAVNSFLGENENNRAVYVSSTVKSGKKFHEAINPNFKEQLSVITSD